MADEKQGHLKISIGLLSIIVLLVIQLVGFAFGYGLLSQQVAFNRNLIATYQTNQTVIMNKLDDLSARIVRLEVLMQAQK